VVALGRKGVKSLDDFAGLASDELVELLPEAGLTEQAAGDLIMEARAHWYGDEAADDDVGDGQAEAGDEPAESDTASEQVDAPRADDEGARA
jgi:N utilization substance protein A